jgi:predicted dehydrogenase
MAARSITVGQIGCGYWGPNLLRNLAARRDVRVKRVAELSADRRRYVSETYPDVAVTESWQDIIDDPEIEAVIVATPAAQLFPVTRAAMDAGKHVLAEKPMARSVEEAVALSAQAQRLGRTLMVGHTFLYNDAVNHLKGLVDEGYFGKIRHAHLQRLNLGRARTDVNAWWNLAPHDVAILLHLKNGERPARISASGACYVQEGIEDVFFAQMTWADGFTANIHVSWLDPNKVRRMTLIGERHMAIYDDTARDKVTLFDMGIDKKPLTQTPMVYDNYTGYQLLHRSGDVVMPQISYREPLSTEIGHFLDCIRSGSAPVSDGQHALSVVSILEAGMDSVRRNGAAVDVPALQKRSAA